MKSRAHTAEECRAAMLEHMQAMKHYWLNLPDKSLSERLDGFAFSILVMFDGGTMALPAMDISMSPHPDDKAYHKAEGSNYFEPGMVINDCQLHELWCAHKESSHD